MHHIRKITVISDTHGVIDDQITSILNDSDIIVHAGDIMSTSIIKKLKMYSRRVIAVAGNNDLPERYSDEEDKKMALFLYLHHLIFLLHNLYLRCP